jgi:autophagy-related protein 9
LAARWYFRDYDELTHVFEERMRIAGRYAKQYTSQFAPTAIEGIARSVAFVIGSIVVWLLLLSFLNDRALLGLELSPSKTLLWWITVLSSVWVICRGMLQDQHVFYPGDALQVVYSLTRRLPIHFVDNQGHNEP